MPDFITRMDFTERGADLIAKGWDLDEDGKVLHKSFRFANFTEAMAFMTKVAFHAEAQNHHPEWLNVYNRVDVKLTTHDAGGLTGKDLGLARAMEAAL